MVEPCGEKKTQMKTNEIQLLFLSHILLGHHSKIRNATMGGWELKFCYEALGKSKGGGGGGGGGGILYKSYATPGFFKLYSFQWPIKRAFFLIYTAGV